MDDLIGVLIFIGFIIISIISKWTQKSGGDGEGKTIEERLEEAIRRSKERAQGRSSEAPGSGPPPRSRSPEPPPYRPAPRPLESRSQTRSPAPPPTLPTPPPKAPKLYIPPPPAPMPEPWSGQPTPLETRSADRRRPTERETRGAAAAHPTKPRRNDARPAAAKAAAERTSDTGTPHRHRKKSFTRRELRELIIFSELMKRPRIIRNHPMYRRMD